MALAVRRVSLRVQATLKNVGLSEQGWERFMR